MPPHVKLLSIHLLVPQRSVIQAQRNLVERMEARPDPWFRGGYQEIVMDTRSRLAQMMNADQVDNVVLVENASSGVNAVLRSLLIPRHMNRGDVVLYLNTAYGMVKNTLEWLHRHVDPLGLDLHMVNITLPAIQGTGPPDFVGPVQAALKRYAPGQVKLAIFSHITSVPAIILPVEKLAQICKQAGVMAVVIDAAHALGQIPINLRSLAQSGVDFYIANAHKW